MDPINTCEEPVYSCTPFIFTRLSRENNVKAIWPKPRSGHRIATNHGNIYCIGGYNPQLDTNDEVDMESDVNWEVSKPLFKELWKFNIARRSWERLEVTNLPDTLVSNALVLSGNILMIYGGTGSPFAEKCSNELHVCNLKDVSNHLKIELVPVSGCCPPELYGQAVALVDKHFYTIGGTDGFDFFCDVHRLDLKTNIWEVAYTCIGQPEEPWGRYRHEIAIYRDKIYVIGGGTSSAAYMFNTVIAFNMLSDSWELVHTLSDPSVPGGYPSPRVWYSSAQMDNWVFIINGYFQTSALKDTWRLDLSTLQWVRLPGLSLDTGLYFHSSCVTSGGKLFVFGGIQQTDAGNSVQRSSDVYTAWACIPKLSEMCWEALLHYRGEKYLSTSREELISLGIPERFVDRIFF